MESNQWRAVLSWAEEPKDLDATVVLANKEVVNWNTPDRKSKDGLVKLDVDAQEGFGPETITITNKLKGNERMSYYVHNFSEKPQINHKRAASVSLYNGNKLVQTIRVPAEGVGDYWHVFDLTAAGEVIVDKIVKNKTWV